VPSREEIRRGGLAKQERRRGAKKKSLCGSAPLRELNKKYTLAKKDSLRMQAWCLREKKSAAADSPSRKGAKKGGLIILCGSAPLRELNKKYTLAKKDSLP
jgi:hypothetical protein